MQLNVGITSMILTAEHLIATNTSNPIINDRSKDRKPSFRQRARVYRRPGLEINYKNPSCNSITSWKRGRSGQLDSTRSQKHHRPPQVTRMSPRRRFLPLIVLRTRVARLFTCASLRALEVFSNWALYKLTYSYSYGS